MSAAPAEGLREEGHGGERDQPIGFGGELAAHSRADKEVQGIADAAEKGNDGTARWRAQTLELEHDPARRRSDGEAAARQT